ncbi:MAG: DNA replication protein [Alphaproteobacteria bacterium]
MNRGARRTGGDQQGLPFGHRAALGRADFIVSPCNAPAVRLVDDWPDWRFGRAAALIGPAASGKSHLAQVLAARAGVAAIRAAALDAAADEPFEGAAPVRIVEDVDEGIDERALLHLFNATLEAGGFVLLTARQPPGRWDLRLPDLASRLRAIQVAAIAPPDDELLPALIGKLFADRQIAIGAEAIAYLVPRVERCYAALGSVIDRLDRAALSEGRRVSVPLIRSVIAAGEHPYDETMNS